MNWDNIFISWNLFAGFGFLMLAINKVGGLVSIVYALFGLFFFSVWANWNYEEKKGRKR